jgi:2-polyprenyl-3-methyl-5-hydroxy-6-metoxy-1,4-benzoquinol methylase
MLMMSATADAELLHLSCESSEQGPVIKTWPNFRRRQRLPEIMDQPDLERSLHEQALVGLARTNCIGSTRGLLWKSIVKICRKRNLTAVRVLDVACGAGDWAIWLKRRCERAGLNALIEGCDRSPVAIDLATTRANDAGLNSIRYFTCDVQREPLPSTYDFITCSLFLHHLTESDAVAFLALLAAAARHAVLVDDLRRTTLGLGLAWAGCAMLTRSPVVHVDAPLSVRAAFREHEALSLFAAADMTDVVVRRHWPQRFLAIWEKPWMASSP